MQLTFREEKQATEIWTSKALENETDVAVWKSKNTEKTLEVPKYRT